MNTLNQIKKLNRYLIIIPARAGSKRIKNKNLVNCAGRKLIFWTLQIVKDTIGYENCYLTTDSETIIKYCSMQGLKNFIFRPKKFSSDTTTMLETLKFTVNQISHFDKDIINKNIILLQPTSPIRKQKDIIKAILMFESYKSDSLVSAFNLNELIPYTKIMDLNKNKKLIKNFNCKKKLFVRNGPSILITKVRNIHNNNLYGKKILNFEMPFSRSVDINTLDELHLASRMLNKIKKKNL